MKARFKYPQEQISEMDLSIELNAPVKEWRKLLAHLSDDETSKQPMQEPLRPLLDCIKNTLGRVEDLTGQSYRTRGFQHEAEAESEGEQDDR